MAVYYKFKSAKDYDTIPIDGHFISVGNLKEKIFESKHLGRGKDFDLVITNAQNNEEYFDESALIPKNTAVLIRRVPGRPRMPIVTTAATEEPKLENKLEDVQALNSGFGGLDSSAMKFPEDTDWDEFGNDLYSIPDALPVQSSNPVYDAPPPSKADEDNKIQALIDTPALDWQSQPANGFGAGRGFVRNGRMITNRNFGRGGFEMKTPPPGYICHRCKVQGHFIQHCPTNGDPNFDIKRVKPPTGIPKSMLMATPDGSYALPSGAAAVLKPNEAAFEKEIEGMPSARSVGEFPPELRCPLCKEVMKDAVLTSKCCFNSFCDKCIRDYIISKSICVCGATNVLADDLLPNKTLRDTINRILEANTDSAENGGSAYQVQDMESRNPHAKIPSPSHSAASKGWQAPPLPPHREETSKLQETAEEGKDFKPPIQETEKQITAKLANGPETIHESASVKEPASEGSAPLADEEVQQKPGSAEAGKKKKKKKLRVPPNAADMQWRMNPQDLAADNYMIPMGPNGYNPYWGMQPGMEGFGAPYPGAMPPYMGGYGAGPMDLPFGSVFPQDPFGGHCMMPFGPPPPRDVVNFGMGFNAGPPPMSREEFEARKIDMKRRREMDRRGGERDLSRERREVSSSGDVSSMKPKPKAFPVPPSSSDRHHHHVHRPERLSPDRHHRSERPSPERRSRDPELPRPLMKKKSEYGDYPQKRDHHDDHRRRDQYDDRRRDYEDNHRPYYEENRQHRSESSSGAKPSSAAPLEPPAASLKPTLADEKKQKSSVFSRIRFPEGDAAASKKRKHSSSSSAAATAAAEAPVSVSGSRKGSSNGYYEDHPKASSKKTAVAAAAADYESSDDDRHFKRRPSRYEASPPPVSGEWEDDQPRHSRGSKEKERDRYSSKHR